MTRQSPIDGQTSSTNWHCKRRWRECQTVWLAKFWLEKRDAAFCYRSGRVVHTGHAQHHFHPGKPLKRVFNLRNGVSKYSYDKIETKRVIGPIKTKRVQL